MKVKDFSKLMADMGTKPRMKVIKHGDGFGQLIYEGRRDGFDQDVGNLKINSFIVLGKGLVEIHAQ